MPKELDERLFLFFPRFLLHPDSIGVFVVEMSA
jgi:hypothetical protein